MESPYALNEIAVLKRDSSSMISIHTAINGAHLTTYQADGLVVSTPYRFHGLFAECRWSGYRAP